MRSRVHVNILVYSNKGDKLTIFLLSWYLSLILKLCSNLDLMIKTNFSEVILLLFSRSVISNSLWPQGRKDFRSFAISWNLLKLISVESMTPSTISSSVAPSPALNLSKHQGLFQKVGSSHQVAKRLEFQLQSFQ